MSGYTTIVNLLDYTACALPVTTADKNVDVVDPGFKPLNELDARVMNTCKSVGLLCAVKMVVVY